MDLDIEDYLVLNNIMPFTTVLDPKRRKIVFSHNYEKTKIDSYDSSPLEQILNS